MALSDADKNAIRCSLGQFAGNLKPNMCIFYQSLLGDYPNYHPLFPPVKGVAVADFGSNTYIMEQQGPKTGAAVADLVGKMDDGAALTKAIHDLVHAPQHTAIPLKKEDYANAFTSLVKSMQKALGASFTDAHAAAWTKFAGVALDMIDAELKKM